MSKVWRHADGREFPATYHYAQDMPDYHSAQVGEFTVSQTLMQILGYTLVEREDPKEEKMEPKTISLGEAMERLRHGLPVECKSGRSGVWEPMRKRGVNAQFRQGDTWRGFPNILAAGWSFRIPVEDPPKPKVVRVLAHIRTAGILIGDALASAGFGPNDPIEIIAVHEDLFAELDQAAKPWTGQEPRTTWSAVDTALSKALRACGIGETP